MLDTEMLQTLNKIPVIQKMIAHEETEWLNPKKIPYAEATSKLPFSSADIAEAEARLQRFAPLIQELFPETTAAQGIIESPLKEVPNLKRTLEKANGLSLSGRLFLKLDSELPIAGSVKARGGIYEVLKHTEELLLEKEALRCFEPYTAIADPERRAFLNHYTIQVGSTGNLGLSIGIMSVALGYKAIVHMSADAREWKKSLLRQHGVTVKEYSSDYSSAVKTGRALSDADPTSYFVDDENSKNLFLGYATAAGRLQKQLEEQAVTIDEKHPLFVYIPCGIGGAPGGITYGLKNIFGDAAHCFFVEPIEAPSMLLGLASGLNNQISVQDIGLSCLTQADGLACGRPSGFVGQVIAPLLSGDLTLKDAKLYDHMRTLLDSENIFIEPSSAAALEGVLRLHEASIFRKYTENLAMENSVHILWATGGSMVPHDECEKYRHTFLA